MSSVQCINSDAAAASADGGGGVISKPIVNSESGCDNSCQMSHSSSNSSSDSAAPPSASKTSPPSCDKSGNVAYFGELTLMSLHRPERKPKPTDVVKADSRIFSVHGDHYPGVNVQVEYVNGDKQSDVIGRSVSGYSLVEYVDCGNKWHTWPLASADIDPIDRSEPPSSSSSHQQIRPINHYRRRPRQLRGQHRSVKPINQSTTTATVAVGSTEKSVVVVSSKNDDKRDGNNWTSSNRHQAKSPRRMSLKINQNSTPTNNQNPDDIGVGQRSADVRLASEGNSESNQSIGGAVVGPSTQLQPSQRRRNCNYCNVFEKAEIKGKRERAKVGVREMKNKLTLFDQRVSTNYEPP